MRKALIIVDYQNDFVTGSLGFDKARFIEKNIVDKITFCLNNGFDLIFTLDNHDENYLSTQEGRMLPVMHCKKNSFGAQVYGKVREFLPRAKVIFLKNSFGSPDLVQFLAKNSYKHVELAGLISNICVLVNAVLVKVALPEAKVVVDATCTASFDDSLNDKAMDIMKGLQINVINFDS